MSYSEENNQVVLRMSREDYEHLLFQLGMAAGYSAKCSGPHGERFKLELAFLDRLNSGNPNYTPYQVEG